MSWVTDAFSQQSIGWLVISTAVAIISGLVSSWLTYRFKRREIVDKAVSDLKNEQAKLFMEKEKSRDERVQQEIIRWANPILGAVEELEGRLYNILYKGGCSKVLDRKRVGEVNPNWSISYDYYMDSTLFLFGQYFAWVRMLQEELSFEVFQTQFEKSRFFKAIGQVGWALSVFPPKYECNGKDVEVFRLQQRAIGELLIIRENNKRSCMGYPEFLRQLKNDDFNQHFGPLRSLFDELKPEADCRWKRVEVTYQALKDLHANCEDLLSPKSVSVPPNADNMVQ